MKRVITLMLALAMVFGAVATSSATDFKAKGTFQMGYQWTDNTDFNNSDADGTSEDDFVAQQRFRTQIDMVASENLSGVVFFEINNTWGRANNDDSSDKWGAGSGGAIGADGVNVQTRRAYIDWTVPNTALDIRMGIQGLALPGAVAGSPILNNDVAAVVASYKFNDMFSMTGFWARPYDLSDDGTSDNEQDEVDMFGLIGGIKLDGMEFTPYAVYSAIGKDVIGAEKDFKSIAALGNTTSDENARAYWLGLGFQMDLFDPIVFSMDAMYGNLEGGDPIGNFDDDVLNRSGWDIIGKLSYKMDMVTPGIIAWYATGEDDDLDNGSERMPYFDGSFTPTSFGFDGASAGFAAQDVFGTSNVGTWAVGLLLEDIKVIDSLTSQFRVVYVKGTNDADVLEDVVDNGGDKSDLLGDKATTNYGLFLTDKDSAWEINFDHKYDIYENLALFVEMGYINLDLDEDAWDIGTGDAELDDDAYKLGFYFQYTF